MLEGGVLVGLEHHNEPDFDLTAHAARGVGQSHFPLSLTRTLRLDSWTVGGFW